MIDPKAITTYAQYNEDIILAALLYGVDEGFYIDVGANYPIIDSVTMYFYEKGWHGINIEPLKGLFSELAKVRTNDINLNIGLGNKKGKANFREYKDLPGHSTFASDRKIAHEQDHEFTDYEVEVDTLKDVLAKYRPEHVNFIKIDVEGFEYEVVEGNDWSQFRPDVICIESNHISRDWRPILLKNSYQLFIADGLNEYYVATEQWGRTKGFVERVVELDYHALKQHQQQSWLADSKQLKKLNTMVSHQQEQIDSKQQTITTQQEELKAIRAEVGVSLKNKTWFRRLYISVYGLTLGWLRDKKQSINN